MAIKCFLLWIEGLVCFRSYWLDETILVLDGLMGWKFGLINAKGLRIIAKGSRRELIFQLNPEKSFGIKLGYNRFI